LRNNCLWMKEFIENCKYKAEINEAVKYEQELAYFIQTNSAKNFYINSDQIIDDIWNQQNPFLNWMRGWMLKENFKSFMKFIRHPLPTASLIQDDIIPELKKVFDATNANYEYNFTSNASKQPANAILKEWNTFYKDEVFNSLINNHNSVIITDYEDRKKPYRYEILIGDVFAIEPTYKGKIKKIAFKGKNIKGEDRYFYYTDEFYSVYIMQGEDYILESQNAHEISRCPADFISVEPLNNKSFVVRKSIFSNLKEKFENYVNYYTLQKMCLPHGAMPVITHYKQNQKPCNKEFSNGTKCINGYIGGMNGVLGNKDELIPCPICNSKTIIQAGTVIGLPIPKFGDNGESPIDLNANFVKFHYIPVEILEWWNKFIDEKYSEIKYILVGKGTELSNGQAKNIDQIARGNQTLENTLIELSGKLSKLQKSLDFKALKIVFGNSFIDCSIDRGTDFYLETEFELRESLAKAIDPIDKENIINRLNYSIYKNNPERFERSNLLYKLLPYSTISDLEFNSIQGIDPKMKELRLNFNYYIDLFEAEYGNINIFFTEYFGESVSMSKKLEIARNILNKLINIIDYASLQNEDGNGQSGQLRSERKIEEPGSDI